MYIPVAQRKNTVIPTTGYVPVARREQTPPPPITSTEPINLGTSLLDSRTQTSTPQFSSTPTIQSTTGGFLKGVGQMIARSIASTALTVTKKINPEADSFKPEDFQSYFGQALVETVFGKEPNKSIEDRIAEAEPKFDAWKKDIQKLSETPGLNAREKFITKVLGNLDTKSTVFTGIMGSVGLDLTPFGGLEKNAYKALINARTPGDAIITLTKMGVADDLARNFASDVVKISTEKEAKQLFNAIAKLQETTKVTSKYVPVAERGVADASRYGKDIKEIKVDLANPLVIKKDVDFAKVALNAGLKVGNPLDINPAVTKANIAKIRNYIEAQGHDGVVVEMGNYMDTQLLRKLFEHDQIVDFGTTAKTRSQLTDIWKKVQVKTKLPELPKIRPTKVPQVTYKEVEDIAKKLKRKDITEREFEDLGVRVSVLKESVENHPGKALVKYISKTTGELPEVTGKSTMKSLTGSGKTVKNSEFGMRGDDLVTELGFDSVADAQKGVDEYLNLRSQLDDVSTQLSNVRKEKAAIRRGEYLMQLAKGDRRTAYRAVRDAFNLTESELAEIRQGRDIMAMTKEEFDDFLRIAEGRAAQNAERSEALMQTKATIFEKEFSKVENLQKALKLPPIEKMTTQQLKDFDEILSQFKQGDEFLGVRQLETVQNTDLKGIKTIREAREALAKEAGVPVEQLDNIKVTELDRYRYDTALARQNPFYDLMVQEKNKAVLNAEMGFYEIKTKLNDLINAARKSRSQTFMQRIIPTDKRIFDFLEADSIGKNVLAKEMTKEELEASKYIQELYINARDYLVQHNVLKKYISDYITHIRRGFLEAWQDDGLMTAFKEVFNKYKQDEAVFNILNERTGEILPLEKFFQFSMKRSGDLKPTKNVASAVQAYFRAFEKKKALDSLVPKLDIYAHSLTPKRLTPKGLEFDNSLKRFVKEWMNSKKGRVADTVMVKPGGKIDWVLRTGVALTRILDLGLSVPIGIASNFGEQITTFRTLGSSQYTLGIRRLATKEGRAITDKYKNFVGEPLMERLTDASQGLGDQVATTMFSLFGAASRRANQVFLLANMTSDEFARGIISPERLARLQTQMGRSRVVENFESVIGKTAPGKVGTQYKSWAVPILSSTLDDITKVSAMLKSGKQGVMETQEFKELMRTIMLSGALGFGLYGFVQEQKNNRDRTFIEDLAFKSARDSLSLIGALDPSFWTTSPRLLSFLNDMGTAIKQLILVEKTKEGELKAPKTLERTLVPKAVKQFAPEKKQESVNTGRISPLPQLPQLPKLPSLPKL